MEMGLGRGGKWNIQIFIYNRYLFLLYLKNEQNCLYLLSIVFIFGLLVIMINCITKSEKKWKKKLYIHNDNK